MSSDDLEFAVGTDVGGTFTDVWVATTDGRSTVVKTPTTDDVLSGIVDGLERAASAFERSTETFLEGIERFGHGTTVGLNALLTGPAESTALLTTKGFADTVEIGRLKRQFAGLNDVDVRDFLKRGQWPPLVPRENVWEVPERIDRDGTVVQELHEDRVRAIADELHAADIESVAISTLWSVENPVHEQRIATLLADALPDAYLSVSHEVAPVIGEYGRTTTTVANAVLGPVMSAYFRELEGTLADRGLAERVLAMTQAGGVVSASALETRPVAALFSGPAAAVIGCRTVGDVLDVENVLTIDVGGTSFDAGLIVENSPVMRSETSVAGADIELPSIDVASIGAGGGSIASVDGEALTVGPTSAGAEPGPACYGRGGTQPTATDADLVLGVLNPEYFIGGQMALDVDAAERAIRVHVAEPLDASLIEAAWGIRRVLDSNMADLLRRVTVERGYDPREFTMIACGGSGPSHAWMLCNELDIDAYVVPPTATAHSAFGTGTCDLRRTEETSIHVRLPPEGEPTEAQLATLQSAFEVLDREIEAGFETEADTDAVSIEHAISCRYRGQHNSVTTDFPATPITRKAVATFLDRFEATYESLYGRGAGFREAGFELHAVRATGTVELASPRGGGHGESLEIHERRPVVFDDPNDPAETAVYRTRRPAAGETVTGPAVIEYPGHTAVVPPGGSARTDDHGNLRVEVA